MLTAQRASDIIGDNFEETGGKGLVIRTNPAGVKVFINGMERGLTPVTFENLLPGEHSVKLFKESYRERQFNITLFNNSRLVVSIEMEEEHGNVLVSVHKAEGSPEQLPFSPQILSGASVVSSNTAALNLSAGYRTIKARAFGWEDASVTVLVDEKNPAAADIYMHPADLKLTNASQSRRRFNPKISGNLGSTIYRFEVSAPGHGTFSVIDKNGTAVYQETLNPFTAWEQSVTWNGRDSFGSPLPEGVYTILIEASLPEEFSHNVHEAAVVSKAAILTAAVSLETEINYSISIFPLSLSGGLSGLAFSPLPHVLPAGSFQLEGGIFLGGFQNEKAFSSVPFEAGMRISPFNRLEISSVFNINPHFNAQTGWGVSGSAKYNILNGSGIPLAFAAGFSYAWAGKNGESPLNPGSGIGIYAPLSLELKSISVVLSPGVFWRGPSDAVPELLLSTGVLYRGDSFCAGLSARAEFDLTENPVSPTIFAGTEWRFNAQSSNLVFSCQTGMWTQGGRIGGYGCLGIGVIY